MTQQEKAKELVNKYLQIYDGRVPQAKQCALISVDEILQSHYVLLTGVKTSIYEYWQEVKQEIDKL